MANHSAAVTRNLDAFYCKMRTRIEDMLADIAPNQPLQKRQLRAALITCQIEGLMVLIRPIERFIGNWKALKTKRLGKSRNWR